MEYAGIFRNPNSERFWLIQLWGECEGMDLKTRKYEETLPIFIACKNLKRKKYHVLRNLSKVNKYPKIFRKGQE